MSTDRSIELIHGEIDGVNTPTESAELLKIVADEGAAREFQDDMQRLAAALERVEDADVPEGLRDSIRSAIRPREIVTPAVTPKRVVPAFTGLRFAGALAAGLVLGLLLGPWVFRDDAGWNPADFTGSMMPASGESAAQPVRIDLGQVSGTIRATHDASRVALSFDISTPVPVELALAYDRASIEFVGFARQDGDFEGVEASDGRVVVAGSGQLRGVVALDRLDASATGVRLEIRRDGELLDERRLNLDALKKK